MMHIEEPNQTSDSAPTSAADVSRVSVFKTHVDMEILYRLLDQISTRMDKCHRLCVGEAPLPSQYWYVIDINSFRLLQFYHDTLYQTFVDTLMPCYHVSKQFYLTRKLTYNSFNTIVRQICNENGIEVIRKPRYNQSMYSVDYFVPRKIHAHIP